MKVVYSIAAKFGGSGIGNTSYNAVKGIFRKGHLCRVHVSSFVEKEVPRGLIRSTRSSFFERRSFLPSSYQWFLKDNYHDFLVSFRGEPCNIFHGWNGHSLFSLRSFRKKGALIVIERASSHPKTFERLVKKGYQAHGKSFSPMLSLNMKKLLREFEEADFITTPSDFAFKSMVENGVEAKKLVRIPFGVDLERFRPTRVYGSNPCFNVLFAGQVGFRKGISDLLKIWEKLNLKDSVLTIAGQVDRDFEPFLIKYRSRPSINFVGYTDLLPLYQSADVFVFPSLEEGSALVTYEALACGLPLVTTFESGSVVEEGREGFIVPAGDAESLGERIKYLYENLSIREEMSRQARLRAEDYSWEKYGDRLVKFYEGVL